MKYTFRIIVLAFVIVIAGPAVFAGTLSGVVRAVGGPGLQDFVLVKLTRLGEPVADQWVRRDGRFQFDSIEPGQYEISAQSLGYETTSAPLRVFGNAADIVLELRSREIDSSAKTAAKAKEELARALKEQEKGNRKGTIDHLKRAASLGSIEARKLLETL